MASFHHSLPEKDIEIIRQVYSGVNRNDVDAVIRSMDVNIVRNEFEGSPMAASYRGITDMRQHLVIARNTWVEGACEPIDFFAVGNKIIVTVHVKVRLRDNAEWIDERIADAFIIQDGKVMEFHSFADEQKALEWARASADDRSNTTPK
jgi:uncharacterized protein